MGVGVCLCLVWHDAIMNDGMQGGGDEGNPLGIYHIDTLWYTSGESRDNRGRG